VSFTIPEISFIKDNLFYMCYEQMRDMQREDRRDFPKEDPWNCDKRQERQEALPMPALPVKVRIKRRNLK